MYLLSLQIAIVAYVYSVILTEPDMLLNKVYIELQNSKLPDWFFKPLIGCFKCVSGQMALWGYVLFIRPYSIFEHVFFICLTIFISYIINKIYQWLNSEN